MGENDSFAAKLALVLGALSMSRGRLAADVGVDKSLVGRWCSGAITPSSHNLARLSQVIADRHPGFSMLDWESPPAVLAARFGVSVPAAPMTLVAPSGIAEWLALPKFRESVTATGDAGASLTGFWRSTRSSPELGGKFVHDHALIQPTRDGPLSYRVGALWARFSGWALVAGDQMYSCATGQALGTTMFGIFNRVHAPRVEAMDGVVIACMADAGGVPCALACLMERIADLSDDSAADEARFETLMRLSPVAPEGSLDPAVERHLLRDTGPSPMAAGGDPIIMMRALASLSR